MNSSRTKCLAPSGNDGQTYLGFATVSTDANGYLANSPNGSAVIADPDQPNASFTVAGLLTVPAGQAYLCATATNLTTNDTSSFSPECALLAVNVNNPAVDGPNGAPVSNTGTFSDGIAGSSVTLTASIGNVVQDNGTDTWTWTGTSPSGPRPQSRSTLPTTTAKRRPPSSGSTSARFSRSRTTSDNGDNTNPVPGSLRQAILNVNNDNSDTAGAPDLIAFDIASAGMQTIYLSAALPEINNPVIIDGNMEAGSQANSLPLKGSSAGDNGGSGALRLDGDPIGSGVADGLTIFGGSSTVQGLYFLAFNNGIHLTSNGNDLIAGNNLPWPVNQGIFVR